jgi:sporulation and spore germination protein
MRRVLTFMTLALLASGCRSEGVTVLSGPDLPSDVYGSPRPLPSVIAEEFPARGTLFLVRRGKLHPVQRQALQPAVGSFPEALMVALIESAPKRGIATAIPPDTRVYSVELDGQTATVDLSAEFDLGGTPESQGLRVAQVVYTLTQEDTGIREVRFEIEGFPRLVRGGERLELLNRLAVTPADYRQFAP